MDTLSEILNDPDWKAAAPAERTVFLNKFFESKIATSSDWAKTPEPDRIAFKKEFFTKAGISLPSTDTIRVEDKAMEPVGMNQFGVLPPADDIRHVLTDWMPEGKPKTVAKNLIETVSPPLSAGEAALMVGGGAGLLYGGKKLLGAFGSKAAKKGAVIGKEAMDSLQGMAGNINLDNITGDNVRAVIKETAPRIKEAAKIQGRGVIGNDQLKGLADDLDISEKDLLKLNPGDIYNAETALAARNFLHQSASDVFAKAKAFKEALDPVGKAQALQEFTKSMMRHEGIQTKISGITKEAGRLLQQFNVKVTGGTESILKSMLDEDIAEKSLDTMSKMADKILKTSADANHAKELSRISKVTFMDKVTEVATAMKLTNPVTYLRNTTGNTLAVLTRLSEKTAAPVIDFLSPKSLASGGKNRDVFFGELPAEMYGMWRGVNAGARAAVKELSKVITNESASSKIIGEVGPQGAVPGRTGQILRTPFHILSATDEFFRSLLTSGSAHSYSYRQAAKEGLSGKSLWTRMEQLVADPSKELMKKAGKVADEFTFQAELGSLGKSLNNARQHPVLKLIVPFFKTPVNQGKFAAQRIPGFNLLSPRNWKEMKKGGAEATEALARQFVGGAVASTFFLHAMEGKITGAAPKNKAERDALERTGWRPYSVKQGDKYVSYLGFDPLATQLAVAADLASSWKERGVEPPTDIAGRLATSVMKNISASPYLKGVSDVLDAMSDPDKSMGRAVSSLGAGFVPTGVAAIARTTDEVIRRPTGLLEAVEAKIPGLSKNVPPKRNVWGEPYVRQEPAGTPLSISYEKKDPVDTFIHRHNVEVGFPTNRVNGRRMSSEEYDKVLAQSGKEMKLRLEVLMKDPDFQELPYDRRLQKINAQIKIARDNAIEPLKVPLELRALSIPEESVGKEKIPLIGAIVENPLYKNMKDDRAKKRLIETMLMNRNVQQ